MKIGEFAGKYHINPSTVRYYVDKALIAPRRENGQYVFDRHCMEQMDMVLYYKKLGFSLEETGLMEYYENASSLGDKKAAKKIVELLKQKQHETRSRLEELNEISKALTGEIDKYKALSSSVSHDTKEFHMPLDILNILMCPKCRGNLSLKNAIISGTGNIVESDVGCKCGYSARISDGILISEGCTDVSPFKIFENIDSVSAITDDFSAEYSGLMERAYLYMYQQILSHGNSLGYIMTGPFSYNFIFKYMNNLPDEPIYIIVDVSTRKIEKIQRYFSGCSKKLIYIAGQMESIPLKDKIISCYIDDFSTSNYIFTYNKNLLLILNHLIKGNGILTGQFIDYSQAPVSLNNFKTDNPDFHPELMNINRLYKNFSDAGFDITGKKQHGSPRENEKHFIRHVESENVKVLSYSAKKTSDCDPA